MRKWMVVAWMMVAIPLMAQESSFIFPQFADGRFPDGQAYQSTLMIQRAATIPFLIACEFTLHGMTTTMAGATGSSFAFAVPSSGGWLQVKTAGTQAFQQGYAVLDCTDDVYATVLFTYSQGTTKLSEAAVFGVNPYPSFKLIADQTEGARLGLAIANNRDSATAYDITLRTTSGAIFASRTVTVPARRSVAQFLDELVPTSANQILEVTVEASATALQHGVIGIKMTGTVLTTIPAN